MASVSEGYGERGKCINKNNTHSSSRREEARRRGYTKRTPSKSSATILPVFRRLRTAWRIYRIALSDKRTPFAAKALPWMGLLYLISPIDLVPDVLPVIGQMDDVTILVIFLLWAFRLIPKDLKRNVTRREVIDVEARRS